MPAKTNRQRSQLERVAYHEAGHAVASYEFRCKFSHVTVTPEGETLGQCAWLLSQSFRNALRSDNLGRHRKYTEERIIILLAGTTAEMNFTGRRNYAGAREDVTAALCLAGKMCGSHEETEAYFNWLWARAEGLWKLPWLWTAVQAVASELLKRPTVSYRQTRQIIRHTIQTTTLQPLC